MSEGGFYDDARAIVQDGAPAADPAARDKARARLRRKMKQADVPADLEQQTAELQARFKVVDVAHDDDAFAMDVEFKFGTPSRPPPLVVKQARPWVD